MTHSPSAAADGSTLTTPAGSRAAPEPIPTSVRLGVIDYLNVAPVYDWLLSAPHEAGAAPSVTTVAGTPAQMNTALESGAIDLSNVSSVAFGQHVNAWRLLPELSVAAHGGVQSVLLFSWQADWRELDGGSIALTNHSATSVALTRLLAEQRYGARPRYVTTTPDLDAMLATHDAALLIGDRALAEGHARRYVAGRGRPYVFDLATEWTTWTGLPFVFSVWAARAERAEAIRASGVVALLRESKRRGLADLERIAAEASDELTLPAEVCLRYLRQLDYELTPRDLDGLRAFLEMALPSFHWDAVTMLSG